MKLSPQRVEGYRNFTTKLWNAARFCEMNGCVLNPAYKPENAKNIINKWILSELAAVAKETAKSLDVFRFNDTASHLYHFTYGTFCDWYIEFTKPILMNGTDEALKTEVRETTGWVLDQLLLLLNPIMPYLTEELHAHLLGKTEPSQDKNEWLMTCTSGRSV